MTDWSAEIDKVAFEVCLDHNRDVDVVRVADVLALLKRVEAEVRAETLREAACMAVDVYPGHYVTDAIATKLQREAKKGTAYEVQALPIDPKAEDEIEALIVKQSAAPSRRIISKKGTADE